MARDHLPIPRWTLIQVGLGKVPRWDHSTQLNYAAAMATQPMHNGGVYDFYRNVRAPIQPGSFSHTGSYHCMQTDYDCAWAQSELDWLEQAKGVYVPILFFKDLTCCDPQADCCYIRPQCWLWAWAWGKIQGIDNPCSMEDYLSPTTAQVSLDGTLETPLREISYATWRYGYGLVRTVSQVAMLMNEVETAQAEPEPEWYIPCDLPVFEGPERFWPRDLWADQRADELIFDWNYWTAPRKLQLLHPQDRVIPVWGNTEPRTQIVCSGDAIFTIESQTGTKSFDMDTLGDSLLYFDTDTGQAIQRFHDYSTANYLGLAEIPRLDFFENKIHLVQGRLTFGITPQWIN